MTLFMDPRTSPEAPTDTPEVATDSTCSDATSGGSKKDNSSTSWFEQRWPVTPLVLATLTLLGGAAYLVDAFGWADVNPTPISVIGLAIVAGGLFARKHFDGGRGLIPIGILTIVVVALSAVAGPYIHDGTGDRVYNPQTFGELESEYVFGLGNLTVDLRNVDFPAGETTVAVDFGIGHARIWLPTDVNIEIVGDLDIGKIDLLGQTESGFGNDLTVESDLNATATVVLDLEAGIGHAEVRRG